MALYVRNITEEYKWILKTELAPGASLNLNETFKNFCKPKVSRRADAEPGVPKFSEFKEDEFDEFMLWINEEIITDKNSFEIIDDTDLTEDELDPYAHLPIEEKKAKRRSMRRAKAPSGETKVRGAEELKKKRQTHKQTGNKLPSEKAMSPKEIAWLPYDKMSKNIVEGIDDVRRLKTALRLARNLNGQERTRKLIEDRINELSSLGR